MSNTDGRLLLFPDIGSAIARLLRLLVLLAGEDALETTAPEVLRAGIKLGASAIRYSSSGPSLAPRARVLLAPEESRRPHL